MVEPIVVPSFVADGKPVTEDRLLGGRVRLVQPASGYRAAIDPVLLAAAVPAEADDVVLDVGCGVGAASLCVAARVPGARLFGIERERALVKLAQHNAGLNGVGDRMTVMIGELRSPPVRLAPGTFDHVMANPPYFDEGSGTLPPDPIKVRATVSAGDRGGSSDPTASLEDWLKFCLLMARPRGTVTIIDRPERLDRLLAFARDRLGGLTIFPLWPGPAGGDGKPAKRIIATGRKGMKGPIRLDAGLVLHQIGGAFTTEADAVLRDGRGLSLT